MEENKQEYPRGKKDTYTLRMIISVMVLMVLFLSELYIMINIPENYVALIVLTVVGLADIYVLIASWIQKNYKLEMQHQEQYEDLFKSEKASYLIMRKSFEEMEEHLDRIEDNIGIPTEEIINAQKSIAKVTINRNKENSDALMNSNDKILNIMFSLEEKIDTTNLETLNKQKIIVENAMKDMIMKQQEIISNIREVELSIRNQLLSELNKINSSSPQIVMSPPPAMYTQPMQNVQPATQASAEAPAETLDTAASHVSMDEDMPEFPIDENFLPEEESLTPQDDNLSSEDGFLSDEDFAKMAAELQEITSEELPKEDVKADTSENILDELPDLDALFAEENVTEEPAAEAPEPVMEEPAPEPVAEEPAPAPEEAKPEPAVEVNSDPNHMMTPEEIAALIAGTTSEVEEPIIETQPIEEEPAEEEPAEDFILDTTNIDMSDPNHKMTPEEIAALFANI